MPIIHHKSQEVLPQDKFTYNKENMSSQHIQIDDALVGYIRSVTHPEPDYMARLREETLKDPLARMQITPEQGALFSVLTQLGRFKKTIEVGVFTGYSSLAVARALPEDGRIVACDISEQWTSIARRYWKEAGLDHKIDLRLAPATETLDALLANGEAGTYDFAFIDADKTNYANYYDRIFQLLRPGGSIAVDNVLWSGRVIDPADNEEDTLALRAFNEKLSEDNRIWLTMLAIGDGLTLAVKK